MLKTGASTMIAGIGWEWIMGENREGGAGTGAARKPRLVGPWCGGIGLREERPLGKEGGWIFSL